MPDARLSCPPSGLHSISPPTKPSCGGGWGGGFGSQGFGSREGSAASRHGGGAAHGYGPRSPESDEDWWSDVEDEEESGGGAGPWAANADEDLPRTLEEACALLNVTLDTPRDEVNRIYTAMARVWHPDKATGEADRERREAKMKRLNAAREFILGRR